MNLNTNGFKLPVYIAKGVATSGHIADIAPLQIGIYDKKTNYVATGVGNGREFVLAGGSPHTKDALSKFYHGMAHRKESTPFFGKDIESFEKAYPSRPASEQWILGYGGGKDDATLKYECGKTYKFKIRAFGESVSRTFTKSLEKVIPLTTTCCNSADCDYDCSDSFIGAKTQTKAWVKAFNDNIEMQELKIKAYPVFSDYAATSATVHDYTLTLTDNGGVEALQDVQRAYPTLKIERKSFTRGSSIYIVYGQASSPGTFTAKTYAYPVTNCDECTTGTYTPGTDTYIVTRPLAGSEDLDDGTARQTYADLVGTDYKIPGTATIAQTDIDLTSNIITETAHGFVTGQAVVYENGSGSSATPLVDATTYYVIKLTADTFKLATTSANAFAGTAIDITNDGTADDQTIKPVITASFLSQNGSTATIKLSVISGFETPTAYHGDGLAKIGSTSAYCAVSAASPVAWVEGTAGYTITRTLKVVVSTDDCTNAATVADVTAHLSGLKNTVVVTDVTDSSGDGIAADHCVSVFQVVQTSFPMKDEYCLTPDNAEFEDVPAYKGNVFTETVSTEDYDATIKVGIRFVAPFFSQSFSDFSYQLGEYWDSEPVRLEVGIYDEEMDLCKFNEIAQPRRVVNPKYQKLYGEFVLKMYIERNSAYFPYYDWSDWTRAREVIDNTALEQVNRKAYYVAYYLKYKEARDSHNFNQKQQHWEPIIFVEEGDIATQQALELALSSITSKFGVELETRGSITG